MNFYETGWFSERLNRHMNIKVYGHYGKPVIAFPCQDKQSDDFANNGMIDALAPFIESGRIKLFCLDSNDEETVSSTSWDKGHAGYKLELYHQYLINEVLPFVYSEQQGECLPLLIGCSMGASHALNHFLRRPELFEGFIALSGKYDVASFFGGYMDENIYNNSPVHYLRNMSNDHYYINIYNSKPMIVVVGKGAWEHLVIDSNYELAEIAQVKGIHFNFNFWDENSVHDWSSWLHQMPYFLDKLV